MHGMLQRLLREVSRVREVASTFSNPVFRNYFVSKAEEELRLLKECGPLSSTELEARLNKNIELAAILERQSSVQNLYYNLEPRVEK
ncbi:uncharacterized protein BBOV_IV005990 [Babesia bovis T2Bo]|uniref:Uncharacterized protein n=1 Tax=Babesia bovis TaxID=5865 RepID=A7AQZ1_BABBO|nr:uncharacterized protein BBOV_IV005990 [Babesia bovis T2Bo]EDO06960.1 hypothetical protein BBOV_IV005990 [Babesia bovis T2Bo]|eukprot:XP_001610528.1 hypothetical protein [Babesia bovis T2Bo]